jgi:hypothetical protein
LTLDKMRLLDCDTLELMEFFDDEIPAYAILSHRWGREEVSFQEMSSRQGKSKEGYRKIKSFCRLAKSEGFQFGWVDTCW